MLMTNEVFDRLQDHFIDRLVIDDNEEYWVTQVEYCVIVFPFIHNAFWVLKGREAQIRESTTLCDDVLAIIAEFTIDRDEIIRDMDYRLTMHNRLVGDVEHYFWSEKNASY